MKPECFHEDSILTISSVILLLFQEHLEYLVPENGFQLHKLLRRSDTKHFSVAVKTSVCQKYVAVGIELKEVAERLCGNDRAGEGIIFRHGLIHKYFQGFPCTAAEGGEKLSIIQKVTTKNFGKTEYEMPVEVSF